MAERYPVDALAPQYDEIFAVCSEGKPVILHRESKELILLSPDEFRKMIRLSAKGQEYLQKEEEMAQEALARETAMAEDQTSLPEAEESEISISDRETAVIAEPVSEAVETAGPVSEVTRTAEPDSDAAETAVPDTEEAEMAVPDTEEGQTPAPDTEQETGLQDQEDYAPLQEDEEAGTGGTGIIEPLEIEPGMADYEDDFSQEEGFEEEPFAADQGVIPAADDSLQYTHATDSISAISAAVQRRSQLPMDPVPEGLAIETDGITRKYGNVVANQNISLHIPYGAIYGLVGKNGAGKSTLVRCLLGLTKANSGKVILLERTGRELSDVLELTGSVLEAPTFYEHMTINQNMIFRAKMLRLKSSKPAIKDALKKAGLFDKKRKKVRTLTGASRQRLAIALAILGNPELLILDEPFSGLDPQATLRMQEMLLDLNTKGTTILMCDHHLSNLWPIATHYGVLTEGVLVTEISAKQIIENQIDLDRDYLHMAEV